MQRLYLVVSAVAAIAAGQSATPTPSASHGLQSIIDNSGNLASVSNTVAAALSPTSFGGVAWVFTETDPTCGPGQYRISTASFALKSTGSSAIVNVSLALFSYSTGLGVGGLIASATRAVVLPAVAAQPLYVTLTLPSIFTCDASASRCVAGTRGSAALCKPHPLPRSSQRLLHFPVVKRCSVLGAAGLWGADAACRYVRACDRRCHVDGQRCDVGAGARLRRRAPARHQDRLFADAKPGILGLVFGQRERLG